VLNLLVAAGYERFDADVGADLATWRERQLSLGLERADGVAGPETCSALVLAGHKKACWVYRPCDGQ
jgi:hypothetical protein